MEANKTAISSRSCWEVRRVILIPGLANATDAGAINQHLLKLSGVHVVIANIEKHKITIHYDSSETDYTHISASLDNLGYPALNNRWRRFKKNLYQFLDTNAKDSANAPDRPCCNKAPK